MEWNGNESTKWNGNETTKWNEGNETTKWNRMEMKRQNGMEWK